MCVAVALCLTYSHIDLYIVCLLILPCVHNRHPPIPPARLVGDSFGCIPAPPLTARTHLKYVIPTVDPIISPRVFEWGRAQCPLSRSLYGVVRVSRFLASVLALFVVVRYSISMFWRNVGQFVHDVVGAEPFGGNRGLPVLSSCSFAPFATLAPRHVVIFNFK